MLDISTLILKNLYTNEDYSREVLPHLKTEYFEREEGIIFNTIKDYILKYNSIPSRDVILIDLDKRELSTPDVIDYFKEHFADNVSTHEKEWLVNKTEKYCQNQALLIALRNSIDIFEKSDKDNLATSAIPDMFKEALSVTFDTHIGHDVLEDTEKRFEYYHKKEVKIPFDIECLNRVTGGGIDKKALIVLMGGPATGKSLFLCHFAASYMLMGKKVLYISMEMSEEKIAERIDANILDVDIKELKNIDKEKYFKLVDKIKKKSTGDVVVKEYPTAHAHAGNFRFLLNELKTKKNFIPDILVVDYMNICASSRLGIKSIGTANSYTIVKAVAEELRGLGVEYNIPVLTATQAVRSGFRSSDPDLTDVSESFGTAATADLMLGIITTDELDEMGKVGVKILKNRYGVTGETHLLGIQRNKMRLYDLDSSNPLNNIKTELGKSPFGRDDDNPINNNERINKFGEFDI